MSTLPGIRPSLRKIFDRCGAVMLSLGRRIYTTPHERDPMQLSPWVITTGDQTLRLHYPLTADSIVVDVGGYEGRWTQDIVDKFHCTVHVFEPIERFADQIRQRFAGNSKVHVYAVGLGGSNRAESISLNNDESSTVKTFANSEPVEIVDATEFFRHHQINHIDLIKINIEAGEYELLENLIASGLVKSMKNIQVQFHNFFPAAREKMFALQQTLAVTHELTFQFPFTWENWQRK